MDKIGVGRIFLVLFIIASILIVFFFFNSFKNLSLTGIAINNLDDSKGKQELLINAGEKHTIGPSESEMACLQKCSGCTMEDSACILANKERCSGECNVVKPESTPETSCMETCVAKGCGEFDFVCQTKNQAVCEKECDMIKEPPAKSEEEQCIRDCVNAENPGLMCKPGEGGEKGDALCQKCAKSCEHLYAGPCLDEVKLEVAKSECNTCEHCYGKPVMGDSGEGYECIVKIECADASAEFGDEPGTGEGIIAGVGNAIGNVVEGIGDFFGNLFSGGDKTEETSEESSSSSSGGEGSGEATATE